MLPDRGTSIADKNRLAHEFSTIVDNNVDHGGIYNKCLIVM